ncbi:ATP-binding protein [Elioraea sp.]|uniref:ATP-binding protein n=1 Tax=Elioraea sp. TaxID=2185103 RepID=UPI0025BACA79|nr:ATP-binding protein [Elioraea sp.]
MIAAFKRILPRTLLGRSVLIIVMPLIVLQAVALQVFYGAHWEVVSRRLATAVAGDIGFIVEVIGRHPDAATLSWVTFEALSRFELGIRVEPGGVVPDTPDIRTGPAEHELAAALEERVRLPFRVTWPRGERAVEIMIQLPDGILHVEAPAKRLFTGTVTVFVLWLIGSALIVFTVAVVFMRNQVKPIRRLAAAAEAFGKGQDIAPIKPEGAAEVRQAAVAFNRMRERIARFLGQRTEMLAGVSHDLRTPLTRMRLGLAMITPRLPEEDHEEAAALEGDIAEMERMIEAYLAFARGEGAEQAQPADVSELLEEVAAKARRNGSAVTVDVEPSLVLPLRSDAMRRCVTNLVDNARRHAAHVWVGAARFARPNGALAVQITVDDDGPGIPPDQREAAFRPFVRLDKPGGAGGGTGLGLTIARDIVRAHGGDLALEASPHGGLRARISLPA